MNQPTAINSQPHAALKRGARLDRIFRGSTYITAFIVFASVIGILISLFIGAYPALHKFGFGFLTSTAWNPVTNDFGAAVAIFGTLLSSTIALLIAVPISFGIALFITQLAPEWLKRPIGTAIELLAAIPSIIYGMWGLFVFAPIFADNVQPWITDHFGSLPIIGVLFDGRRWGLVCSQRV